MECNKGLMETYAQIKDQAVSIRCEPIRGRKGRFYQNSRRGGVYFQKKNTTFDHTKGKWDYEVL